MASSSAGGVDNDAMATAGKLSSQLESELENVCREMELVEERLAELLAQQGHLADRREHLTQELQARKKRRKWVRTRTMYTCIRFLCCIFLLAVERMSVRHDVIRCSLTVQNFESCRKKPPHNRPVNTRHHPNKHQACASGLRPLLIVLPRLLHLYSRRVMGKSVRWCFC